MAYRGRKRNRYYEQADYAGSEDARTDAAYHIQADYGECEVKRSRGDNAEVEGRLPFDLKEYTRNVAEGVSSSEAAQDHIDDITSKCVDEFKGYETALCCDPDASRHLETICRFSLSSCLQFCNQLLLNKRKSILRVCTRPVGSRCLESILYELRNYLATSQTDDAVVGAICGFLSQIGDVILEEFDSLVANMHSTHILRAFGRVCCGLARPDRRQKDSGQTLNRHQAPTTEALRSLLLSKPELRSCVMGLTGRVLDWKSMCNYYHQESVSCLVQEYVQLEATSIDNLNRHGLRNLVASALTDEYKEKVLEHWMTKQASRAWESIIQHCQDNDAFEGLYQACLNGRLAELTMDPFANFPLQRLLEYSDGKDWVKEALDELLPMVEQMLFGKRCGVLVAMAAACRNNKVRQKEFKKALRSATGCSQKSKRDKLFSLTLQLTSNENSSGAAENIVLTKDAITPHGSALIQHLLHFRKPRPFVDGLLWLKIDQVLVLASHPAGSHILDAFLSSDTVSPDQKAAMRCRLTERPVLIQLACDKYGSRLVDKLWEGANNNEKSSMAETLTGDKAMTTLSRSPYGKILWMKYQLERFKTSPKEWRKFMSGVKQKKRLLQDLLK